MAKKPNAKVTSAVKGMLKKIGRKDMPNVTIAAPKKKGK